MTGRRHRQCGRSSLSSDFDEVCHCEGKCAERGTSSSNGCRRSCRHQPLLWHSHSARQRLEDSKNALVVSCGDCSVSTSSSVCTIAPLGTLSSHRTFSLYVHSPANISRCLSLFSSFLFWSSQSTFQEARLRDPKHYRDVQVGDRGRSKETLRALAKLHVVGSAPLCQKVQF